MARTQTRPWDPAEHLKTEEDMVDYLNVALDEGDLPLIVAALGTSPCPANDKGGPGDGAGPRESVQVSVCQR